MQLSARNPITPMVLRESLPRRAPRPNSSRRGRGSGEKKWHGDLTTDDVDLIEDVDLRWS